jgi:hypothetical protein
MRRLNQFNSNSSQIGNMALKRQKNGRRGAILYGVVNAGLSCAMRGMAGSALSPVYDIVICSSHG